MTKLIESGATQDDADVCNAIQAPTKGCDAGPGVHIAIPPDWLARIKAGEHVPGCTYHALQPQAPASPGQLPEAAPAAPLPVDALLVSDFVELRLPDVIASLPPGPERGAAAQLLGKLNSAKPID
jgi:hypothetical protein